MDFIPKSFVVSAELSYPKKIVFPFAEGGPSTGCAVPAFVNEVLPCARHGPPLTSRGVVNAAIVLPPATTTSADAPPPNTIGDPAILDAEAAPVQYFSTLVAEKFNE